MGGVLNTHSRHGRSRNVKYRSCFLANHSNDGMKALESLDVVPVDPQQRREVLLQGEIISRGVATQLNFLITGGSFSSVHDSSPSTRLPAKRVLELLVRSILCSRKP
jgi:hypothetical protein